MDEKETSSRIERHLGTGVLVLLLIGCVLVMRPFLSALMWAFVLCFALWPVYRRVVARLKGRRTLAALAMTGAIAMVLVVPTVVTVLNLAEDAHALTVASRRWVESDRIGPPHWVASIPLIGNPLSAYWQDLADDVATLVERSRQVPDDSLDVATTLPATWPATSPTTQPDGPSKLTLAMKSIVEWARSWLPAAGLAIAQGVTQVILSVFLTFFIFRDGETLAIRLGVGVSRIAGERGQQLLLVAGNTVRGVVYGILGTALVQGAMAAVGFFIAGVPGAALLGLVTFLLSPLPVGPPLVWIPATLWLFNQGWTGWAIFMLVWGIGVSSIDNVVKPWIISQGADMPFILIFFGVIGGALAFGLIGVFLGPTLLAVAYRLIEGWSRTSIAAVP